MMITKGSMLRRNPWLVGFESSERVSSRLFCFPYAGGGASVYRDWHRILPASIGVYAAQPPGRGDRVAEPLFLDLPALIEPLTEAIKSYLDKPFAFFGHSMGALIAFELARKLRAEYDVEPAHLFVSGRRAPQVANSDPVTYNLDDAEFIEELRRLNGTPKVMLDNPELMELMGPTLRADFQVCQTYIYTDSPPLDCPITVFGGLQDEDVTLEYLQPWRDHTNGAFELRLLPGDHFFLHSSEAILLRIIAEGLRQHIT
jgi:medium-chain acyl-[acyl-carrier-protein] hydrolase